MVAPANPLISTSPDPSDVTLSDDPLPPILTDSATLTGSYHATGTITFDLYGAGRCDDRLHRYDSLSTEMGRTSRHSSPRPQPPGLPITGTYDWVVTYSGDANNNPRGQLLRERVGSGPPGQPQPQHGRQPPPA